MSANLVSTETPADIRSRQTIKPEWIRVPDAVRTFGISRSGLYDLIGENKIRSTAIKKRGALRGIRLISFDSLAEYIENAARQEVLS